MLTETTAMGHSTPEAKQKSKAGAEGGQEAGSLHEVREAFAEMAAPPAGGEGGSQGLRWACENLGGSAELDQAGEAPRVPDRGVWGCGLGRKCWVPQCLFPCRAHGPWSQSPLTWFQAPGNHQPGKKSPGQAFTEPWSWLSLLQTYCVALGKLFNLSGPLCKFKW